MKASLSVRIPIYNQPENLDFCLQSIAKQTVLPSEILLFDDKSTLDYKQVLTKYQNFPIKYIKNENNLGAVPNMINALYYPSNTDYILVFHEDDYMQPQFIEHSVNALEENPETVFCCSNISFFSKYTEIEKKEFNSINQHILNKEEYIYEILKGKTIGFGTIVYNSNKLKKKDFEFDKYSVFGDRPFLIELIGENKIAYINKDLSAVYNHSNKDNRWLNVNEKNVINLFSLYKRELGVSINKEDRIGFTHGIVNTYNLIPRKNRENKFLFYYRARKNSMFSIKYYLLSFRVTRKIVDFIKS